MSVLFDQLGRFGLLVALVVSVVVISSGDAAANNIPAGYDSYYILPSSTVDFATDPIPADFFGPGSDPFDGASSLEGDTIIERIDDATFVGGPPPAAVIDVEIVSLNLVSVVPITVSYLGGGTELWDLRVELLGPGPGTALADGTLTATESHPNGGTYDSTFNVQPVFIFTKVGDPGNYQVLDYYSEGIPAFNLDSTGDPWSHLAPLGIPANPSYFFPGGTPSDQSIPPQTISYTGGPLALDLVITPEPATMGLLALGALALIRRRRK